MNKNINAIDLLFHMGTTPNHVAKTRLNKTRAVLGVLSKAESPMTAREILTACGKPSKWCEDEVNLPDGTSLSIGEVVHALRRLVVASVAEIAGSREVWYNTDEDTKKRGEIRLYSIIR